MKHEPNLGDFIIEISLINLTSINYYVGLSES